MKKIAISMLLIMALILSACSSPAAQEQEMNTAAPEPVYEENALDSAELVDTFYSQKYYPFSGGYVTKGVVRQDSSLLVYGSLNGETILGLAQYSVDAAGTVALGETKTIPLDFLELPYASRIYGITAGGDGLFYVLIGEFPPEYMLKDEFHTNPDYQGRFSVLKLSVAGEIMSVVEISAPEMTSTLGLIVDQNEQIIVYGNELISVDKNGVSNYIEVEGLNFIVSAALCGSEIILLAYINDFEYLSFAPDSGSLEAFTMFNSDNTLLTADFDGSTICQGLNDEYIVSKNARFYSCELDNPVCEELYRWNYEQYFKSSLYASRLSEKSFACALDGEEYLLITGMAQKPIAEKNIVNVALYDVVDSSFGIALRKLNAAESEYEYIEKNYRKDELDQLLMDINSNSPPDLLIHSGGINTSSQAFDDLYPYLDSDSELSRDSFLPNLLDALSVNGELHEIWHKATISTLAARVSDVEDEALTISDYERIVSESEKYQAVFQTFMSKENLLMWVSTVGVSAYVDKANGLCDFENPDFAQLVAWCALMGNEIPEGNDYTSLDISEVLLSVEPLSGFGRLNGIGNNFGEPYVFVGFPIGNRGMSFYGNDRSGCMAIPSGSQNKAGAWEYIKSLLAESVQVDIEYSFPVNLAAFNRMAEAELTAEEQEVLTKLLDNTLYAENYGDNVIKDIIIESGRAYLAGDKSLEDTVAIIQARASVYLAEQYG